MEPAGHNQQTLGLDSPGDDPSKDVFFQTMTLPIGRDTTPRTLKDTKDLTFWSSLRHTSDSEDFTAEALEKYGRNEDIPVDVKKALLRKIDWIVLPCLGVCYTFYYVDKTTLSYAAIFGIRSPDIGLNLTGEQYAWLSSVFYFGWLAWSIPSNLLMQRRPPVTYLGLNIVGWGVFVMLQAAVTNFASLAVLRIISGAFEAIADPAFMLITTMWYTREEQPMRISIWYSFNGVGVAVGGLLGYGIGHIKGSLASWRYEFLIVGAVCTLWGFGLLFLIPNSHRHAWWLTREERLMAVARLRTNQTGIPNKTFKMDQFRETFEDPKTYCFFFVGFLGAIPGGGISNFSTIIIQGLGFNTLETTLLGLPQGGFIVFYIMSAALINRKIPPNSLTLVCAAYMIPTIAGTIALILVPQTQTVARLISFYICGSYQASFVLCLSLITANTAGHTKKILTNALIWLGSSLGSISAPFFFKSSQTPTFPLGVGAILTCVVLQIIIFLYLRVHLARENVRRAKLVEEMIESEGGGAGLPDLNETAFADLSDRQNIK